MKLWFVSYDDGDYYCEGEHWIGPYATAELAQLAIEAAKTNWKTILEYTFGEPYGVDVITDEVEARSPEDPRG